MKSSEEIKTQISKDSNTFITELASFFELLAQFDYVDKKQSEINTGPLVSAPEGSILVSE